MADPLRGVRIAVLGPLAVSSAGNPVPIARGIESALLDWLVLAGGRGSSVHRAIEALWPAPAGDTRAALRRYGSRLRQRLAPFCAGDVVRLDGHRVALDVRPLAIDILEFEDVRARSLDAVARAHYRAAGPLLASALALWRGEPYAEIGHTPAGAAEAARLTCLRRDAEEARQAVGLVAGDDARAANALGRLVEDDPARERAWRLLMMALACGGRHTEALRSFQRCRIALADEGTVPSPATRRLEDAIIGHASLDPSSVVAEEFQAFRLAPPRLAPGPDGPVHDAWKSVGARRRVKVVAVDDTRDGRAAVDSLVALATADGACVIDVWARDGCVELPALAAAIERSAGGGEAALAADALRRWPEGDPDDTAIASARHEAVTLLLEYLRECADLQPVCVVVRQVDRAEPIVPVILRYLVGELDAGPVLVAMTVERGRSRAGARNEALRALLREAD